MTDPAPPGQLDTWPARVARTLDPLLAVLAEHGPKAFVASLAAALAGLHASAGAQWAILAIPAVRRHPATAIARRGLLGDHAGQPHGAGAASEALLLDILYDQHRGDLPRLPAEARRLNAAFVAGPLARAVRQRRMHLADAIDAAAVRVRGPAVMALGCGHLREAEWSLALADGAIARFVAADPDQASLDVLEADYGDRFPVIAPTPIGSDAFLAARLPALGRFDLIYAASLDDCLGETATFVLATRLFGMLEPGGHLRIANFAPGLAEAAMMDAVFGWLVRARSPAALANIVGAIAAPTVAAHSLWPDTTGSCWYLDLTRS